MSVTLSSLPEHFRILAKFGRLMPSVTLRSQRKCSNMSVCRTSETSETCDESIAWRFMPVSETSMLPSVTRSLMASMTFLSVDAFWSVASNMVLFRLRAFGR